MRLPTFDHNIAKWDRVRAFHMDHRSGRYGYGPAFVQFDTGELICELRFPRPDQRYEYKNLNVRVFATGDRHNYYHREATYTTPDGEPIKNGWLHHDGAMQYLLHDLDTKRVVRLYSHGDYSGVIPTRFRGSRACSVYFPGAGEPPIGAPVKIVKPLPLTQDERSHIAALRAACKAWDELAPPEEKTFEAKTWSGGLTHRVPIEAWNLKDQKIEDLLKLQFNDMTPIQRLSLARKGTIGRTQTVTYPHILIA
jgi:hypothetical protein